jgi:hypothetical protein
MTLLVYSLSLCVPKNMTVALPIDIDTGTVVLEKSDQESINTAVHFFKVSRGMYDIDTLVLDSHRG